MRLLNENKVRKLEIRHSIEKEESKHKNKECKLCSEAKYYVDKILSRNPKADSWDNQDFIRDAKEVSDKADHIIKKYNPFLKAISLQDLEQSHTHAPVPKQEFQVKAPAKTKSAKNNQIPVLKKQAATPPNSLFHKVFSPQ